MITQNTNTTVGAATLLNLSTALVLSTSLKPVSNKVSVSTVNLTTLPTTTLVANLSTSGVATTSLNHTAMSFLFTSLKPVSNNVNISTDSLTTLPTTTLVVNLNTTGSAKMLLNSTTVSVLFTSLKSISNNASVSTDNVTTLPTTTLALNLGTTAFKTFEELYPFVVPICTNLLCTDSTEHKLYELCQEHFGFIETTIYNYSNQISALSEVLLSILLSIIILVAVGGNSLVILTFVLNKHMRSVTNVFILSLAASDLMKAFTCVPLNMAFELTSFWKMGKFACKLFAFVSQFSVACSSLTLCCIAFDRYYAIVHPLKLKFLQTPRRAAILQTIVILLSMAASLEYAFFFDLRKVPVCKDVDEDNVPQVCVASDTQLKKVFEVWITLLVLLCGPFIFMSIMYGIIGFHLWVQRPIGARLQKQTDGRNRLKKRAIKMLITVVCIFAVCRSPLLLFNAIAESNHLAISTSNINWRAYLQCLSLSSACWNPIVYAFMNEKFRKAFTTLLRCKRAQVYPVLKRNNIVRMSTESRKTTTQLETPALPLRSQETAETRA